LGERRTLCLEQTEDGRKCQLILRDGDPPGREMLACITLTVDDLDWLLAEMPFLRQELIDAGRDRNG
jgi:hypothetical protein